MATTGLVTLFVTIPALSLMTGCFSDPIAGDTEPETLCNGVDDDDDGEVDEDFDNLGEPCTVEEGICAGEGFFVCSADGTTTVCQPENVDPPTDNETTCDDLDNDCDGSVDEGCDDDGDGYCDINFTIEGEPAVCSAGIGDCDDEDESVNPGGASACDGVDNDCDGDIDELSEAEQPVASFTLSRDPSTEANFDLVVSASESGYCILDKIAPSSELVFVDPELQEVGRADLDGAFSVTHPVALSGGGCAVIFIGDGASNGTILKLGADGAVSELALDAEYVVERRRTFIELGDGRLVGTVTDSSGDFVVVASDAELSDATYVPTGIGSPGELQVFEAAGGIHGFVSVQDFVTIDLATPEVTSSSTTGPLFDAEGVIIGTISEGESGYAARYSGSDRIGRIYRIDSPPRTIALADAEVEYPDYIFPSDFAERGPRDREYLFVPGLSTLLVREDDELTAELNHSEIGDLLLTLRHSEDGIDMLHVVDRGAADGSIDLSLSRYLCD